MELPSVEFLNICNEERFKEIVKSLFELAPILFERIIECKPFQSYEDLIDKAEEICNNFNEEEKIETISGHPLIGRPSSNMSKQSLKEQGSSDVPEEVYEELEVKNQEHIDVFGFPFIIFVNGRSRPEILNILKERLEQYKNKEMEREDELNSSVKDLFLIARDRLKKSKIINSML
eukprot:TRINITY_DN840_c0_g1_i1.p1 TRINITY_DN840_c0_g1~~TRINITY_DN840_c0_g1_i1.p1  ORF type:complete len:176 (-),score=45.77 TRINITY_DN840_c0_g1_i1:72-599(-)